MKPLTILKIGGNVIDYPDLLEPLLDHFTCTGGHKALVHGGGKIASQIMRQMGIEPRMVNGRRITDRATLDIVTMVYAGLLNKKLVASLQARGCNALGLSGADANVIPAHKRPATDIDYGYAGDVDASFIPAGQIDRFISQGLTPVFAPITHDGHGTLFNTNADTIASSVAVAMARLYDVKLVFCMDKPGVLERPDDDTSVISRIDEAGYANLCARGIISGGMIPKLESAFEALHQGVQEVLLCAPGALLADDVPYDGFRSAGTSIRLK